MYVNTKVHANRMANTVPYRDMRVAKIDIMIRTGEKQTKHELWFDDLSAGEMKRDGFCGPVYLTDGDGGVHECELTAGHPEDMSGDIVRGLAFTVECPRESGIEAHVVHYSPKVVMPLRATPETRRRSAARP